MNINRIARLARHGWGALLLAALAGCHDNKGSAPTQNGVTLEGEAKLSTDAPGATSKDGVRICRDGDQVYAIWTDFQSGGVHFNASSDGGASWLSTDSMLPKDITLTVSRAAIACDGLTVHVAYRAAVTTFDDIYYLRSEDGGATWAVPVQISSGPTDSQETDNLQLACVGNEVYAVWDDERDATYAGDDNVYLNVSHDAGLTWLSSDMRLDQSAPGVDAGKPQLRADGSNVYICWREDGDGETDVYFNSSLDAGNTFQLAPIRLDTGDTPGLHCSDMHRIACSGSNVYVAWSDTRDDDDHVYLNASADGGLTWLASDVRVDHTPAGGRTESLDLACDGQTVCVAWEDDRNGVDDIHFNRSSDGGPTWLPVDLRLDTDSSQNDSDDPLVCMEGTNVIVVWDDDRDGVSMRLNCSTDGGLTFLGADVRLDDAAPGQAFADEADLICEDNLFHVSWSDMRMGSIPGAYVNCGFLEGGGPTQPMQ